jgi:hypothetical protein
MIEWAPAEGRSFRTVGVDCDQVMAAIIATEKMLNRIVQPAADLLRQF